MSLRSFATSDDERVIAGVCAGIAQALGVDVTLVRLVFALLALAGGAGIALYLALWAYGSSGRTWVAAVLVLVGGSLLLHAVGLSDRAVGGIALVAAGSRSHGGKVAASGPASRSRTAVSCSWESARCCCSKAAARRRGVLAPGAVAGALLLIAGPWLWRLALDRDAERSARIRSEERSEVAARVHDSVLQTLALIQRHAQEPRRVASLARRQERELRGWLYGEMPFGDESTSLVAALSAVAADVEEVHGVRVELASAGDCPADDALVLAAREAMANAAKFAGVEEIDVYAEVTEDEVVSVRPRPRRRLRPRCRASRPARARRLDRGPARARRRHGDDRDDRQARAPRSSCGSRGGCREAARRARRRPRALSRRRAGRARRRGRGRRRGRRASPMRCR